MTTPDGWPVQVADPLWTPEAFGFVEFQKSLDAVLMGRTTFEPAIGADRRRLQTGAVELVYSVS